MELPTPSLNHNQSEMRLFAKKREAIFQLWRNGESVRRIAKLYNLSTQRIYQMITTERKRRGLK